MAPSNTDVDFNAIAKAYFSLRLEQQRTFQRSILVNNQSQMAMPDFSHLKLVATEPVWDDRTNVMAANSFAHLTRTVTYPANPGHLVSGHVEAVAPQEKGAKITVTKGRMAALGGDNISIQLSLPPDVKNCDLLRKWLVRRNCQIIKIDPRKPETSDEDDNEVGDTKSWPNMPGGAAAYVESNEGFRYEGRFSCAIFPKGNILLRTASNSIQGANPDIQTVIRTLKGSRSPHHQELVKNFYVGDNDQPDSQRVVTESRFFWKFEGTLKINNGTELSVR